MIENKGNRYGWAVVATKGAFGNKGFGANSATADYKSVANSAIGMAK
ncbi:MAG: hypothetical protein LBR50_07510 [Tannerella sp.]|jgi:hypothetical protein|nr:hypothetical protein [Tannerella sp.]